MRLQVCTRLQVCSVSSYFAKSGATAPAAAADLQECRAASAVLVDFMAQVLTDAEAKYFIQRL